MNVTPGPCGRTITLRCLPGGVIEHCGQGAREFGKAHAAAEIFLVSGARCPCHVKARGSDTGEGVQHRLRFGVAYLCAVLSHAPPVFHYVSEVTPVRASEERPAIAGTKMVSRSCAIPLF